MNCDISYDVANSEPIEAWYQQNCMKMPEEF
jgi:hypothetical protein